MSKLTEIEGYNSKTKLNNKDIHGRRYTGVSKKVSELMKEQAEKGLPVFSDVNPPRNSEESDAEANQNLPQINDIPIYRSDLKPASKKESSSLEIDKEE